MSFERDHGREPQPRAGASIDADPSSSTRLVRAALVDSSSTDLVWLVGARELSAVVRAIKALHTAMGRAWSPQYATESSFRMVSHRTSATVRLLASCTDRRRWSSECDALI